MVRLFGREWTKRELLARVGDLSQIAGVEPFVFVDGVQDGVRAVRVRTGGGLDYTVLWSRGMDIAQASYNGFPFAWVSSTGRAHPNRLEPEGRGWLRTFHGGLLTGCGLSNAGAANTDGEEPLGLHGYLSHIPAEDTGAWAEWQGDSARTVVDGTMREARVFGENLRLMRRITSPVGGRSLTITDTVENYGFQTSPLMLLYHLNFGWPLISEETELVYAEGSPVVPRDADAEKGLSHWNRMDTPTAGYAEQCFFHDPIPSEQGAATVLLINRAMAFAVAITYDKTAFPFLTQWKMMGQGEYVCGIEPGNCRVLGRTAEREAGRLQSLLPGEVRRFVATIRVLDGVEEIETVETSVKGRQQK